jgi:hypothetical protein
MLWSSTLQALVFPHFLVSRIHLRPFPQTKTVRANAAGNALEFYTPSAGVSTFLGLTDTPASFTNGKLLYSTASGVQLTTTEIAIDGGNIEVDQVNARQNDTTNIGDSSHRFNTVHCLALHQGTGKNSFTFLGWNGGAVIKNPKRKPEWGHDITICGG